jgi:hypothetical protein
MSSNTNLQERSSPTQVWICELLTELCVPSGLQARDSNAAQCSPKGLIKPLGPRTEDCARGSGGRVEMASGACHGSRGGRESARSLPSPPGVTRVHPPDRPWIRSQALALSKCEALS